MKHALPVFLFFLFISFLLTSCGPKDRGGTPALPEQTINESIINKWVSIDGQSLHGINELDYSSYALNTLVEDQFCDGSLGNTGLVNGVPENNSMITGELDHGFIQFGHLSYVNASIAQCRDLSKERYEFDIKGKIMRLCMINYPFCADYEVVK